MILLGCLYLYFFMLTVSSYGQPVPLLGNIYHGTTAGMLVYFDSLICLYLFLGIVKRQRLTWHLLLGYNAFELVNTLTNMFCITTAELEKIAGEKVDESGLLVSNSIVIVAVILLSWAVYRQKSNFINRSKYLF